VRAVVQRVQSAEVTVNGQVVGRCGPGLVLLVAAAKDDDETVARLLADRVFGLRIFGDEEGKMNKSLSQQGSADESNLLAISNFTLYGDVWASRRPSFMQAAPFESGERLFNIFVDELRRLGGRVETGIFGADMKVSLVNDGPVTIVIDSRAKSGT